MGEEDDGLAQHRLQAQELVLHLAADQRVERREGLVEEPDLRLHRQRAGDADALLLAAGQLARIIGLAALEADQLDDLAGARLAGGTADTLHLQRKADVLQPREMRQQGRSEEHTSELQPLLRTSYAVSCLKKN